MNALPPEHKTLSNNAANDDGPAGVCGVEFAVSTVSPATDALPEVAYKQAVEDLLNPLGAQLRRLPNERLEFYPPHIRDWPIESCSRYHGRLVAHVRFNPVMAAVHLAFDLHRPLVLSPDIVWLAIVQGFAHHVAAHAEKLRPKLVDRAGKLTLSVRRDEFVKGSPENTWPDVFAEFSGEIRKHIGAATHDLLLPAFSTTGPIERAACEIVLLDAMKSYFEYEVRTLCGIPWIALEGTSDDWTSLAAKVQELERFDLRWWTIQLAPILDQFASASRGDVNRSFWKSICKFEEMSGGPYISGWINAFFPYLKDLDTGLPTQRNEWFASDKSTFQRLLDPRSWRTSSEHPIGPTMEQFPIGLSKAPFRWVLESAAGAEASAPVVERTFDMEFLGGFVGIRQDSETLSLRPEIGWVVREARDPGNSLALD